nr:ScpA family protein [Sphingomonas sp. BT552]
MTLDLDGWEGPLDLLLALARSQKVDLRAISILSLVEQYLAFIEEQAERLERAADYLVMAAKLAYLKSALLLPREPEQDPDPDDLALRLQLRLERLDAMREAGARLMARDRLGRDVFLRGAAGEGLTTIRRTGWQAEIFDLIAAYGRVSARTRPALHVVASRDVMTLEAALERVAAMLATPVDWTAIERFLPPSAGRLRRSALASSFLAALELARQGRVELYQREPFAPLMLRRARS